MFPFTVTLLSGMYGTKTELHDEDEHSIFICAVVITLLLPVIIVSASHISSLLPFL